MSRQKISEFVAKTTLYPIFDLKFHGLAATVSTTAAEIKKHFGDSNLVLKVDQGIKKRGKLGLVKINISPSDIPTIITEWVKQGWTNFLVEPVYEHDSSAESYLSLSRTRYGWDIKYSKSGGIEIESHWDSITDKLPTRLEEFIHNVLIPKLDLHHIAFLEMNPIVLRADKIIPLDMAVEVDTSASSLPTLPDRALSDSERIISELDHSTPASLKFHLINPSGSIWMLLSGGGASLVLADEVADLGLGGELANYGEYSGAPTDDDVYAYTKTILGDLLLLKNNNPKAIIVAGGVANFTDVKKTFQGLIRALDEQSLSLQKSGVKVFVRRGGPNEEAGLKLMRGFLTSKNLLGCVYGHDTPLTQVVSEVRKYFL